MFIDGNYSTNQDDKNHVFIILNSIRIILKVTGPVIMLIYDKYVSNQVLEYRWLIISLSSTCNLARGLSLSLVQSRNITI